VVNPELAKINFQNFGKSIPFARGPDVHWLSVGLTLTVEVAMDEQIKNAEEATQPRWGQLQHQFCRPEELPSMPAHGEPVGWPGDPPSVAHYPVAADPALGSITNQSLG
jgi:hypothetical protein